MKNEKDMQAAPATVPAGAAPQTDPAVRCRQLEAELARLRGEFASVNNRLSHDLQGILGNVSTFAGYVRESAGERLSEREKQLVGRIEAGAQRGASVMRDLGALVNVATADMHPRSVEIDKVAAEALRDLRESLGGRAVQVELPQPPCPHVEADLALTRLALWHLLANAVKFTRPVTAARIQVSARAEDGACVIAVTDNGVGFNPQYAHKLFGAFGRLHYDHEFEGNGIGLAIVKEVAARHGGRVGAEPLAGGGARFWMRLPLARAQAMPEAPPAGAPGASAARRLVLAIDDEPLVLMTIKTLLERDGTEVLTAVGGEEGLRAVRALSQEGRKLDVVISDWLMPQVGGAEIVKAARQFHPASRIILLTGLRPQTDGQDALPQAVDAIVAKPVRAADLRRAVAQSGPG